MMKFKSFYSIKQFSANLALGQFMIQWKNDVKDGIQWYDLCINLFFFVWNMFI